MNQFNNSTDSDETLMASAAEFVALAYELGGKCDIATLAAFGPTEATLAILAAQSGFDAFALGCAIQDEAKRVEASL